MEECGCFCARLNCLAFGERLLRAQCVRPSVCQVQRGHKPSVIYLCCYISVPGVCLGSCDRPDCVLPPPPPPPPATAPRAGRMSDSATHSHGTKEQDEVLMPHERYVFVKHKPCMCNTLTIDTIPTRPIQHLCVRKCCSLQYMLVSVSLYMVHVFLRGQREPVLI